jgi:hypothetical protein
MAKVTSSKGSKGSTVSQRAQPETVKLKITLDRETARLLRLEAFGRDCSLGQVITELVKSSPRRFILVDRAPKVPLGSEGESSAKGSNGHEPQREARPLGLLAEAG